MSLVAAQNVQPPDQQPSTTAEAPTAASANQANSSMGGHQGMLNPTLTTGVSLTASDLGQAPDTRALTLFAAGTGTLVGAGLLSRGAPSSSSGQAQSGGAAGTSQGSPIHHGNEQENTTLLLTHNTDAYNNSTLSIYPTTLQGGSEDPGCLGAGSDSDGEAGADANIMDFFTNLNQCRENYIQRDISYSNWGLVETLADDIKETAQFHAPQTGVLDEDTFAILMGTIIAIENNWGEVVFHRPVGDAGSNLTFWSDNYRNSSTGIANIRPSVALEILNGEIPLPAEIDSDQVHHEYFELMHEPQLTFVPSPPPDPYQQLLDDTPYSYGQSVERGTFSRDEHLGYAYNLLQSNEYSLDFIAANINRGIRRAQLLGIEPSIFNIATWYNKGIQQASTLETLLADKETRDFAEWIVGYGNFNVRQFGLSASMLDLPIPTGVNAYNSSESQNESALLEGVEGEEQPPTREIARMLGIVQ